MRDRIGRFQLADGGTLLFLDEIGDMPLEKQAKLLGVLQGGEFQRIDEDQTCGADVRIIAASNRDLLQAIRGGAFARISTIVSGPSRSICRRCASAMRTSRSLRGISLNRRPSATMRQAWYSGERSRAAEGD
jgi:hypothetical protein